MEDAVALGGRCKKDMEPRTMCLHLLYSHTLVQSVTYGQHIVRHTKGKIPLLLTSQTVRSS